MTVRRENTAQQLCNELFLKVEGALGDAWISDDAGTDDPEVFLRNVLGHLYALEEARVIIKKFLRTHKRKRRLTSQQER
jgi:hypothetical protein